MAPEIIIFDLWEPLQFALKRKTQTHTLNHNICTTATTIFNYSYSYFQNCIYILKLLALSWNDIENITTFSFVVFLFFYVSGFCFVTLHIK